MEIITPNGKGLGRWPVEDEKDHGFLMQSVLPPRREFERRYWWPNGWRGDQGSTPHCVEYSWWHKVMDGPHTLRRAGLSGRTTYPGLPGHPNYSPGDLYCMAQEVDEWEGDCSNPKYEGTSVRAGAKVLHKAGIIDGYLWGWDLETVIRAVLHRGAVVLGTWWYADMFEPDEQNFIWPTGRRYSGHAYLLNGISIPERKARIKNSWGDWGNRGMAWLTFDALEHLIRAQGEACLPVMR